MLSLKFDQIRMSTTFGILKQEIPAKTRHALSVLTVRFYGDLRKEHLYTHV